MQHMEGLSSLADFYDGFIIDLWGVIHDGVTLYPGALECLNHLQGRQVLLLSNAPRRVRSVRVGLQRLGLRDELYTALLTSGEATWLALRDRRDPWFAALGEAVYHIGPERDRNVLADLPLTLVHDPVEADFILNTGPDDARDGASLEAFFTELSACLRARLPMICANPDLEIIRGDARILCAGALAAWYSQKGGEVRMVGKPDAAIYDLAVAAMRLPRSRILAVGDSLRTDIAGAAAAAIDAVWVLGGLHAEEVGTDHRRIVAYATAAGLSPMATVPRLVW